MWQDLLGHERRFWKHQLQTKKQKTHHKQTIKQQQTHFLQLNKLNLSFFAMGETQHDLSISPGGATWGPANAREDQQGHFAVCQLENGP